MHIKNHVRGEAAAISPILLISETLGVVEM